MLQKRIYMEELSCLDEFMQCIAPEAFNSLPCLGKE
jgi:hypothetical protein